METTPTRWYHDLAYFFGGAFLANTIPHLVNGISGRPFQSPFASPPGRGLSSPTVNVLWAMLNLAIAYGLVARVGRFDLRRTRHVVVLRTEEKSDASAFLCDEVEPCLHATHRFAIWPGGENVDQ